MSWIGRKITILIMTIINHYRYSGKLPNPKQKKKIIHGQNENLTLPKNRPNVEIKRLKNQNRIKYSDITFSCVGDDEVPGLAGTKLKKVEGKIK